ncbi:sodium-dependent phosphate transport protein 1, chloroplastic-like [Amphibalanus amphitrite]|uniref:sodium-dependent phosphate transport protein 1, chloroplastic-like n=1 Tax=Amphibalanus amphitrite TaxID=1232801 RepID=UPI001C9166A4|nr:sodium-dependent phosphate transport protein 1, chloroplastic-like [Amphibalanus amphitrite]XP_043236938.1 sodium-dependent phosphate transport protein 1, chloroplastic-like [Amphibalanus amphitrite]XP_043236939.1 sodium-dependent phosphate transport protein 1, chloroplastic-like [Amphibalanus amphitrite]
MTRSLTSRHIKIIVSLCSAANFINAADRVLMPIAIIPMTDEFGWTLHWQGWILSSFALGYLTSQIIGGSLATRVGGRSVLLFAVLLWSLSTVITPLIAHSISGLIICRILLGLGEGLGLPTIFHVYAHYVPVEERSRAFGYLIAAGGVGQTVAAVLCPHLPWRTSFILLGLLGLAWLPLWCLLYPDTGDAESEGFMSRSGAAKVRWAEFVSHWPLWAIYIAHFAMNWSNYIIMHWLPTYLSRTLGANTESISLTAVPYIVNSVIGVAAGHLADRLITKKQWTVLSVRRLMTTVGLVGPAVFLLLFCAVTNLPAALLLVSIVMGFCAFNSAGHLSNHAEVAPNHAGVTFAISNTLATIPGILCGPVTADLVTASQGRWFPVFALAAAVNLVGAIVYYSQSSALQLLGLQRYSMMESYRERV